MPETSKAQSTKNKRRLDAQNASTSQNQPKRQRKATKSTAAVPPRPSTQWPPHFNELYKVFKAMNTFLAFAYLRKQLAISFNSARSSIEKLLNHPLNLTHVAEIKALLPNLIDFGYVPSHHIKALESGKQSISGHRGNSPDYSAFSGARAGEERLPGDEPYVLVLEFTDDPRKKKAISPGLSYQTPTAMTSSSLKKLVEQRNQRFEDAINDLTAAAQGQSQDPVALLVEAGREHVPINPTARPGEIVPAVMDVPAPAERPPMDVVLSSIREQEWFRDQICEQKSYEAREGCTGSIDPPLSSEISEALLNARGISGFYTHQSTAIQSIAAGKSVIVSTSTASGKSIIYQVPALRFLEASPDTTAIFVYPTKALAQDQRVGMEQLIANCPTLQHVQIANYDGDTPQEFRQGIRETASIIFTNFDMIHASILPHEDTWRRFLKNLKLFVVDELHYYSGLLGSHVAYILRRLRRLCAAVGNRRVQFVSCSATISNPRRYMLELFGVPPESADTIVEDGAPSSHKDFLIWNSPLQDPDGTSNRRRSSMSEAITLMEFLMVRGVRVILFCKTRKACELATKALRSRLSNNGRLNILEKVQPYRGGYSQQDRRRIERDAFNGNLLGIIATNALELGVDIGVLDAVIMLGFPVTKASFWQQAGRAGRRSRDSLVIFVAEMYPIDQYYIKNPQELFQATSDEMTIDLEGKIILEAHLQCAAHEMPLSLEDEVYFGPLLKEVCDSQLVKDSDGWYHPNPKFLPYPAKHISIRGPLEDKYTVIKLPSQGSRVAEAILEEVEVSRAMFELYEGGVFMHQGEPYIVTEISHDSKIAKVLHSPVNFNTSPRDFTNVDAIRTHRIRQILNSPHRAYYGRVDIYVKVFGFFKIQNNSILDAVDVDTPPWEQDSTGLWIDIPTPVLQSLRLAGHNAAEAIHAAQHALLNQFLLSQDIRTECKAAEKEYRVTESQRKRPARLIFYDAIGKGGGVAVKAFDHVSSILTKACDVVESCPCQDGCTHCVQSARCKEANEVSSKIGASIILKAILGKHLNLDAVNSADSLGMETIVPARPVPTNEGIKVETEELA